MGKDTEVPHLMQFREKGSGADGWYCPDRDMINLFPTTFRNVFVKYDDSYIYQEWCVRYGITEDDIKRVITSIVKLLDGDYINHSNDFEEVVKKANIDFKDEALFLILSAIGWEMFFEYHKSLWQIRGDEREELITKYSDSLEIFSGRFRPKTYSFKFLIGLLYKKIVYSVKSLFGGKSV